MKNILAPLPENCLCGHFIRRHKRFSVEVEINGQNVWAHSNNSGSMLGLLNKDADAIISPAANKNRKLPYTLERLWVKSYAEKGIWVGVNTMLPNKILATAFKCGLLEFAKGYTSLRREAPYGASRLDAYLSGQNLPDLWVECKSVTLMEDDIAYFPDAASVRGQKHLQELIGIANSGARAAMFYFVQRSDCRCFAPADFIDPDYSRLFYNALAAGVEMYVYQAVFSVKGTGLGEKLEILPKTGF